MTTYINHWADVIGTAYKGLSGNEKKSLEGLENEMIKIYTGAQRRLKRVVEFDEAYTVEVNHIEGFLDGIEDTNDNLKGIVSENYYNTVDGLISLWDEFFTTMLNEAVRYQGESNGVGSVRGQHND